MRFIFGLVVANQWDWKTDWTVFVYEWSVCCISAMAAY